jgi:hypothetical protein
LSLFTIIFFCCQLHLLSADTRQPKATRCGILFYFGSCSQTINVWVGCTDTPSSARHCYLIIICL